MPVKCFNRRLQDFQWKPIGNSQVFKRDPQFHWRTLRFLLETPGLSFMRPEYLIGDLNILSETSLSYRRPQYLIGDLNILSKTPISYRRPQYLIGDPNILLETSISYRKSQYLIRDSQNSIRDPQIFSEHPSGDSDETIGASYENQRFSDENFGVWN